MCRIEAFRPFWPSLADAKGVKGKAVDPRRHVEGGLLVFGKHGDLQAGDIQALLHSCQDAKGVEGKL